MRKRIGIEVQRLFRPKKHGMEVVALELIRELKQIDTPHEYVVFVKKDADRCVSPRPNMQVQELGAWPYPIWEQIVFPWASRKMKLDLLHSTCNTSTIFPHVPLVLTLHDIIYLEKLAMSGTPYQNFGNIYRRLVVPSVVEKAQQIITVSEFEKEVIMNRLKVPEEKISVVYNAVGSQFNIHYSVAEIEAFRKIKGLPKEFILFLGNTAPKKNTKHTIAAYVRYVARSRSPLPMVILDYDRELVLDQLRASGDEPLMQHFVFPGYLRADEMPLAYNAASMFLYPSIRESFGLPILEAMACGLPVITSNTSSMPEVAGGAAHLVDPFNVTQLAEAIELLASSLERKSDLIVMGLRRAEKFTWRNAAEQLIGVYDKVH